MIRRSRMEDIPRIKEIWQENFGDSDDFLFLYFENYYRPEEVYVREEKDEVVSIATIYPDWSFVYSDGNICKDSMAGADGNACKKSMVGADNRVCDCAMIYAVATSKDHRGHGYAMEVIREMIADYQKMHADARILITPADEGLRELYATRFGFSAWGTCKEISNVPTADGWMECDADAYQDYREAFLIGKNHVTFTNQMIDLQRDICKLSDGGNLWHQVDAAGTVVAICCIEKYKTVQVKEWLGSDECSITIPKVYDGLVNVVRIPASRPEEGTVRQTSQMLEPKRSEDRNACHEMGYAGLLFD